MFEHITYSIHKYPEQHGAYRKDTCYMLVLTAVQPKSCLVQPPQVDEHIRRAYPVLCWHRNMSLEKLSAPCDGP